MEKQPTAREILYLKEIIAEELSIGKNNADFVEFKDGKFKITSFNGHKEICDYITLEKARGLAKDKPEFKGHKPTIVLTDEAAEANKAMEENPLFDKGVEEMIRDNAIEKQFEEAHRYMAMNEKTRQEELRNMYPTWMNKGDKEKEKRAVKSVAHALEKYGLDNKIGDLVADNYTKEVKKELRKGINVFEKGILFGDWEECQKYIRSDNQMGEEEWTVYEVVIVDKERPELLTKKSGEYHVAKTPEMALGKAGYYDMLDKKGHDDTKLKKKVIALTDVRPVEDDE